MTLQFHRRGRAQQMPDTAAPSRPSPDIGKSLSTSLSACFCCDLELGMSVVGQTSLPQLAVLFPFCLRILRTTADPDPAAASAAAAVACLCHLGRGQTSDGESRAGKR